MTFPRATCPKCKHYSELMFSNNPLIPAAPCFDCINDILDYNNLEHADFFCRTFNLPFSPENWLTLVGKAGKESFKEYTRDFFENRAQPNLFYEGTTKDVWAAANKLWESCRTQAQIISKLPKIKESYIERALLKWGVGYSFEEYIKLDSVYLATLKANNIVNPLQKEAVKMLCKIQVEMNKAIIASDTKAIKDYSTAYSTFAKQACLEDMIEETKTDEITTVAELYQFLEDEGFRLKFYDGFDRDEVDKTIKDINEANRRVILESSGLNTLLEQMAKQRLEAAETQEMARAAEKVSIEDLMGWDGEKELEIEVEEDEEVIGIDWLEEDDNNNNNNNNTAT